MHATKLLAAQQHTSLSFLQSLSRRFKQARLPRQYRQLHSTMVAARKGPQPRPDAEILEEKRSQRAVGGSDKPRAPSGSLFALELKARRHTCDELARIDNKFPLTDTFALDDGRLASSAEILEHLDKVLQPERLDRIRMVASNRTFSIVPLLEGINDKGNVGAVARSADALGYGALHYVKTLDPRRMKTGGGSRTSGGSQKWLDMQVWDSTGACLKFLKAAGYFIAATHLAPDSVPISKLDWTRPTCIVMGNESYGVSHEALEYADQTVIIPQAPSFVDSFNVSVACALVLYEARGSRIRAVGRHGDLSPDQQRTLTAAMLLRHKGSEWGRKFLEGAGAEEEALKMEAKDAAAAISHM